jgi:hypothetical protein
MTFDPTTNRIQFKLLSVIEQSALHSWPHGWEYCDYNVEGWFEAVNPEWHKDVVYRGKPAPITITTWTVLLLNGSLGWSYGTRSEALDDNDPAHAIGFVRVDMCNGVPSFTFEKIEGEEG